MENEALVLCDTNILIEFYKGNIEIGKTLESIKQKNIRISVVTAGELLFGVLNKKELKQINKDISFLGLLNITESTGRVFIELMNKYSLSHNLNLPDGLIAATSIDNEIPLFTLNTKDFKFIKELELFSYSS